MASVPVVDFNAPPPQFSPSPAGANVDTDGGGKSVANAGGAASVNSSPSPPSLPLHSLPSRSCSCSCSSSTLSPALNSTTITTTTSTTPCSHSCSSSVAVPSHLGIGNGTEIGPQDRPCFSTLPVASSTDTAAPDHPRPTPLSRRNTALSAQSRPRSQAHSHSHSHSHSRTPTLSGLSSSEMAGVAPGIAPLGSGADPEAGSTATTDASKTLPDAFILPNGHPDYLRLILTSKVYEVVQETPLTVAQNLSNRLECNVLLKREDLHPVFSFKLRGAYNKMAHLDAKDRWKGVVACSAGNHAQGVAYSARHLKIPATIVMPQGTPAIKHLNVSRLGGSVVLHGADFDAAKDEAARLARTHGLTNIPPFDDPYVIAGQGTIGMELLRQTDLTKLEAVVCTVGGGGLIAGIGAYIKRIAPHVKIVGAETYDACAMSQSLATQSRVQLRDVGLFADGAAVKVVGSETFRLATEVVDEVVLCTTDEICAAIKDVFEDTRSILEPAGALAVAAVKKYARVLYPSDDRARTVVAVASGANMDFDRLRFVAERAKLGEGKEALLAVTIPERPGAFARLVDAIGPDVDVSEFRYRFSSRAGPEGGPEGAAAGVSQGSAQSDTTDVEDKVDEAFILMGVEFANAQVRDVQLPELMDRMSRPSSGGGPCPPSLSVLDCSGSELAKTHIRYLVGGRSSVPDERLFMFEFPERKGALHRFLQTLQRSQPSSPPGDGGDANPPSDPTATTSTTPTTNSSTTGTNTADGTNTDTTVTTAAPTPTPTSTPAPSSSTPSSRTMFNISLFHYRNQGGDVGRILAGIQCRPGQERALARFLAEVGYRFEEVTGEKVYQMFMRS